MKKKKTLIIAALITALMMSVIVSCSSEQEESHESIDASNQTQVDWSIDTKCAMCHKGEESSAVSVDYLCGRHFKEGNTCISCHNDESSLSKAHEGATSDSKLPKKLKKTEVFETTCLNCHNQTDLIVATESSMVLTDIEGTVANPHDIPVNDTHAVITCVSCHSSHTTDFATEEAVNTCTGCHHENVYECYTCHD